MAEGEESGMSEAELKMLEARKKQAEKEEDELREYEEQRRAEREKELEDIQRLKERREQRKKEREEEERRMAELRQVEEQRRRQEEEERLRKKREEEAKKREAILQKQQEMMRYDSQAGKPNYVIQKKSGGHANSENQDGENNAEEFTKTKEQLEAEKKAALAQRIQPLSIDGFSLEQLLEKAKELHQQLHRLESDKYDLEQRYKKQQGDLLELAERARQMNKGGKSKQNAVKQETDALADKYGAPTKITMYSPYERVKDRRSFVDRRELYTGPMFAPPTERIKPEGAENGQAHNEHAAAEEN